MFRVCSILQKVSRIGRKVSFDVTSNAAKFKERMVSLPYYTQGIVVHGFGRGSKQLGIPTANFPEDTVNKLPQDFKCGIYFGWACIDCGPVNKMVTSIGWNPQYKNEVKSMETHILHSFEEDFYGANLKIIVLGYLRPEKKFDSIDELIAAIKNDILEADKNLDLLEFAEYRNDKFFRFSNQL